MKLKLLLFPDNVNDRANYIHQYSIDYPRIFSPLNIPLSENVLKVEQNVNYIISAVKW